MRDNYQMVVGVCKDDGVIVDITYNGILDKLNDRDLKDVYMRLTLLRKEVRNLIKYRWWNRFKEKFKWTL